MILSDLEALKNTILEYNTYFNKGFAYAIKTDKGVHEGEQVLFPNDTLGNYFYLRPVLPIGITQDAIGSLSICSTSLATKATVWLVAVVKSASRDVLASNMLSTLSQSQYAVKSYLFDNESVIRQELSGMGDVIEKSIQNDDGTNTIIAISFEIVKPLPLYKLNCLPNPCSVCG